MQKVQRQIHAEHCKPPLQDPEFVRRFKKKIHPQTYIKLSVTVWMVGDRPHMTPHMCPYNHKAERLVRRGIEL